MPASGIGEITYWFSVKLITNSLSLRAGQASGGCVVLQFPL